MECCAINILSKIDAERVHMLRGKYQIPKDIHTCHPTLGKWCCSSNYLGVGIHEAYLLGGLRLTLKTFAREILHKLGIAPNQLNPNGWRIIMAMQALWREVFEGNYPLTMDEFLYCYKPTEINKSLGFYQFSAKGSSCRIIRSLPSSNRLWNMEFFFVFGSWAGDPVKVGRDTFHPYIGAMGRLQSEGMLLTLALS